MALYIPAAIGYQMVEHAVRSFPAEAVGFLAGTKSTVEKALPLPNLAPQGAFLADPYEQYLAERSMQSDAVDVLAIYHSHPDGCTCLSDLDAQLAARWSCVHVVISLQASTKTVQVRGHQLIGSRLSEVELICPDGQFVLHGWGWRMDRAASPT